MTPWIILGVAAVLVTVIGLLFVGWGVGKTREAPPQITIDIHDAIDFCSEALPDEVTAQLSYEDLRRLMRYHLEWVQFYHWTPDTSDEQPVFYEQLDAADYVAERADFYHLDVDRDQIEAVVRANDAFLQFSGAIGVADSAAVQEDLAEVASLALAPGRPEPAMGPDDSDSDHEHHHDHDDNEENSERDGDNRRDAANPRACPNSHEVAWDGVQDCLLQEK